MRLQSAGNMANPAMRASLSKVARILKSARKPKQITQKPFDYDPSHYQRLCSGDDHPSYVDLINYALDMTYMELQPDLLRYLFPLLLRSWQKSMVDDEYGAFAEQFWPGLLRGTALTKILTAEQAAAVSEFMRLALLDRLDLETELHFKSGHASPYRWIHALNDFATVFVEAELFFEEWWRLGTTGHAVALLQYVSPLIYEDRENPFFDPWTPERGGGAPCLWANGSLILDTGWRSENVSFLRRWLTADRVCESATRASVQLHETPLAPKAAPIVDDVKICRALIEKRLAQLPDFLSEPHGSWTFDS